MNDRSIPRIIHQTWKSKRLPRDLGRFRKTWLDCHPDWVHWLWTDADNRAFLEKHYPWFLPVYDNYERKIMQVDAVRYFILHRFGGVYADLDLECLQPIDSLLEGKRVVIGCEPPGHLLQHGVEERGDFGKILCNAFMASVPEHPFWEYVMRALPARGTETDPLSATGPFFLTRTYESYENKQGISVEPYELLYPLDKNAVGRAGRKPIGRAYTVHHWRGAWWSGAYSPKSLARGAWGKMRKVFTFAIRRAKPWIRRVCLLVRPDRLLRYILRHSLHLKMELSSRVSGSVEGPGQVWVSHMSKGECVARASVDLPAARTLLEEAGYPLVSCLMVTRERLALAQKAVECFCRQTYPNRELVIVNDAPHDGLEQWVNSLNDPLIRYISLADEGKPLGELRNLSFRNARGEYFSQWDDDDMSHPDRLMVQMSSMFAMHADASFLHQQILWHPDRRRLGVSARTMLENTMLVKKDRIGKYQTVEKGEDTPLCEELVRNSEVVLCNAPNLYIYLFHGGNTWDEKHFEGIWKRRLVGYKGGEYDRALSRLQKEFGTVLDEWAETFAAASLDAPLRTSAPPTTPRETPHILVLTPVKNAAEHVQRFINNLDASSYPKERLSLAFLESDSDDGTYGMLEKMLPELRERYARVELFRRDFGYRTLRPRWTVSEQFVRRSILARSRNLLLSRALRDEEWVLWMDVDLLSWPPDAIERLLAANEDIVVPHCARPDGTAFDLNTFVLARNAHQLNWSRYVYDGILQPPVGYGRHYLGEFTGREKVEVDGVGGTMLLVCADAHREGLVFPAYSHDFYIETEGLAQTAKAMGYRPCGLPGLIIVHG